MTLNDALLMAFGMIAGMVVMYFLTGAREFARCEVYELDGEPEHRDDYKLLDYLDLNEGMLMFNEEQGGWGYLKPGMKLHAVGMTLRDVLRRAIAKDASEVSEPVPTDKADTVAP